MQPRAVSQRRVVELRDGWRLVLTAPGAAPEPAALSNDLEWLPALVPGTAAAALAAAGRWTIDASLPLHDRDVWYRAHLTERGRRTLRFDGLATIAEVWLNGKSLFASDNMFLAQEVDVELSGDDELAIVFRSLHKALEARKGRARWRTRLIENNVLRQVRTTLLGHMTGWQPAVHAVGPWRAVTMIEQSPRLRVRAVDLHATLDGDAGVLTLALDLDGAVEKSEATMEAAGHSGSLVWRSANRLEGTLHLPGVEKWWPHTHGTPALHDVKVKVGDIEIDLGRTGFRSIAIDRGVDGQGFGLVVNGVPVFARGASWSASDLMSLAGERARLQPWLEQARDAHMNMLRVGGTMIYESDDFYALCDEFGLMVWQDFMLASMDYPAADVAFRTTVEAEAAQFLDRTRTYPSLAVLCGGSEIAQQPAMLGLPPALWHSPLYDEILPAAVSAKRPDVPYVAYSPGGGVVPFSTDSGVAHYFGVGAYLRPLEDARRAGVRFASECLAFANVPAAGRPDPSRGVPRDRGADWDFADVRDHYLELLYGVDPAALKADDAPRYLQLSRSVSADVMEATFAEWRRPASSCRGGLVWMLKDFTPGAGWGVIDSDGLPKLAWHGLRRAFRPVQVALTDEGLNGLAIHLLNETTEVVRARLSLTSILNGDVVVMRGHRDIELPPRSATTMNAAELIGSFFDFTYAYRFGPAPLHVTMVTLDDLATGSRLAEDAHYPLGRAALDWEPAVTAEPVRQGEGWSLRLRAGKFAPRLQIEDAHYRAEEEAFPMLAGEERTIRLIGKGTPPTGLVFAGVGTATPYTSST